MRVLEMFIFADVCQQRWLAVFWHVDMISHLNGGPIMITGTFVCLPVCLPVCLCTYLLSTCLLSACLLSACCLSVCCLLSVVCLCVMELVVLETSFQDWLAMWVTIWHKNSAPLLFLYLLHSACCMIYKYNYFTSSTYMKLGNCMWKMT